MVNEEGKKKKAWDGILEIIFFTNNPFYVWINWYEMFLNDKKIFFSFVNFKQILTYSSAVSLSNSYKYLKSYLENVNAGDLDLISFGFHSCIYTLGRNFEEFINLSFKIRVRFNKEFFRSKKYFSLFTIFLT